MARKVGLSLSGGAVRGIAHVGVIQTLEEHGIPIDIVAGTSAGAFAGVFVAAGLPAKKMATMSRMLDWSKISSMNLGGLGILKGANMARFIHDVLGDVRIEDLPRAFAAMAVGLQSGRLVAFTEGPVAPAVMASTAIPGVFAPVDIGGELYVDGGVKAFDPVAQVRAMGADYCISVKLVPPSGQRERPRNIVDLLLTAFDLQTNHIAELEPAGDVTIRPDLAGTNAFEFKQRDRLIRSGREAAEARIDQIKRDLGTPISRLVEKVRRIGG